MVPLGFGAAPLARDPVEPVLALARLLGGVRLGLGLGLGLGSGLGLGLGVGLG